MPNRKVSIWMYVKIADRWRYAKPVEGRNHKLKPGWCVVNGVEHHHPHGGYYIRYREGAKTIWQKCRSYVAWKPRFIARTTTVGVWFMFIIRRCPLKRRLEQNESIGVHVSLRSDPAL
jgi:hypothetical protein